MLWSAVFRIIFLTIRGKDNKIDIYAQNESLRYGEGIMKKIISLRAFACGEEQIDFSDMFINSQAGEQTLPINVLMLEHRKLGTILVNTGCTDRLKKNLPQFIAYRQKHKLRFEGSDSIIKQLDNENVDPRLIRRVILTHCSPECCGALPLLPRYELISSAQVLCLIKAGITDDSMMKSTMPEPSVPVKAAGIFNGETPLKKYFKWVYDISGDGSVLGVDLRGHCQYMTGLYFTESRLLYAADAAPDERVLDEELVPSEKLLALQAEPDDYLVTLSTLRRLHREQPDITVRFMHSRSIPVISGEK